MDKINWSRFNGAICAGEVEKIKGGYFVRLSEFGDIIEKYTKSPFEAWNLLKSKNCPECNGKGEITVFSSLTDDSMVEECPICYGNCRIN